jgi:tetratricopeptide (TPR) repeat protein
MSRSGLRTAWVIVATIALIALAAGVPVIWDRLHPDPASLARRAYERGEWQRAADLLRDELKADSVRSADPEVVRIYARSLVRLERDSAAGALYAGRLGSLELEPEDAFLKGLAMTRTGRPEAALEWWRGYVNLGVDHAEMLDHYSRLAARFQRMDPALDAARRLCRQPGWEARGRFILGSLSELIDDPSGVVSALSEALRGDPEARGALFPADHYRKLLARNLLCLGRPAEAEEHLKALRAGPAGSSTGREDAEAQWLLGRAYLQEGRMPEAAEALAHSGTYGAEHRLMPEPGPYVGSSACVPCHREESRHYDGTRHTRTFFRGEGLLALPLPDRPVPDPDDPRVFHSVRRQDDRIEASSQVGDRVSRMVVEYAFGTPDHYVTMIARDTEWNYRALRVSYYRTKDGSGWGPTAGDVGHSDAPEDRLGQRIDLRDGVVRCLHCHVTRSRDFRDPPSGDGPSPASADRAIGCERCHGPGGNHLRAVAQDFRDAQGSSDFAIINIAGAPVATTNGQCVECHTVGVAPEIERAPDDPRYVRSPGVTFAASRCFIESGGALSCMNCHDPHREAEHAASFYEAKCLECHAADPDRPRRPLAGVPDPRTRGDACPVDPVKDCLSCHMPKVPVPTLHKSLTDHYIRIRPDRRMKDRPLSDRS